MTASPPTKPAAPKKPRGRWFKVRVVIAAILLVAAFLVYLNARNSSPPRVLAILSQGRAFLDVPVMTFYSFPSLDAPGYWVETNYSFSRSTLMTFGWSNVAAGSLPVRFVLSASGPFQVVNSSEFSFSVSSTSWGTGSGLVRPGAAAAEVSTWVMDYVVREMAVYNWLGEDHWIEVDYGLASHAWCLCSLPAANTSAPSSADMVPVGLPLNLTVDSGVQWSYGVSVDTLPLPATGFHHQLPSLTFPLGSLGSLSATLTSRFQWGPGASYAMRMGGDGPAKVNLQMYLDTRFGSLLAEPLP